MFLRVNIKVTNFLRNINNTAKRTGSKCNSLAIYIIRASVTDTLSASRKQFHLVTYERQAEVVDSAKLTPSLLLHISTVWRLGPSFRNKSGLGLP